MNRQRWLPTLGALLSLAASALAQGPPPGGGPPGMPPQFEQMMAQIKYRRQMRDQLRAVNEIDRDPATALTPAQAKQLLAIVKPWTTKEKMTEEDAKAIMRSVKKVLNPRQLTALGKVRPARGPGFGPGGRPGGPGGPGGGGPPGGPGGPGGGGPPPGGPGGPGGGGPPPGGPGGFRPGGPGGPPPGFDPSRMAARMKTENFLSTRVDPNNPFSSRRAEGNKALLASLEARARGGTTARQ